MEEARRRPAAASSLCQGNPSSESYGHRSQMGSPGVLQLCWTGGRGRVGLKSAQISAMISARNVMSLNNCSDFPRLRTLWD